MASSKKKTTTPLRLHAQRRETSVDAERLFDDLMRTVRNLETQNAENISRIASRDKMIRVLREEKIKLARENERLQHRLKQCEESHEEMTRRAIAELTR